MNQAVSDYMRNARPLRELFGFSQTYVAFRVGVSQSLYCRVENGQVKPTLSLIEDICSLYGISLIDFLGKTKRDLLSQVVSSDSYKENKVNY
jgi:transcriptional regulator with XRE-family HTH domain